MSSEIPDGSSSPVRRRAALAMRRCALRAAGALVGPRLATRMLARGSQVAYAVRKALAALVCSLTASEK